MQKNSYKGDRLRDMWLTGITRPAGSCNLVTLSTNFAQYKIFVCSIAISLKIVLTYCEKTVLVVKKSFTYLRLKARNLRPLEQSIKAGKGQNDF